MTLETASEVLIQFLRTQNYGMHNRYGYDVYLPNLLRTFYKEQGIQQVERTLLEEMPAFYAAAWELCRRGIIRPGVNRFGSQSTDDGSAGNGYSLTPFGKKWLEEKEYDDYVPTEPGRFAKMLEPFREKFGIGFYERAQEAIRCYGAHSYLACCVMCGASAESILLSAAISKKDEIEVLKLYNGASGRSRIENLLVGKVNGFIKREFNGYLSLLKYWRNISTHGKKSNISENEAYTSLALLLRFASFMSDNWKELTKMD